MSSLKQLESNILAKGTLLMSSPSSQEEEERGDSEHNNREEDFEVVIEEEDDDDDHHHQNKSTTTNVVNLTTTTTGGGGAAAGKIGIGVVVDDGGGGGTSSTSTTAAAKDVADDDFIHTSDHLLTTDPHPTIPINIDDTTTPPTTIPGAWPVAGIGGYRVEQQHQQQQRQGQVPTGTELTTEALDEEANEEGLVRAIPVNDSDVHDDHRQSTTSVDEDSRQRSTTGSSSSSSSNRSRGKLPSSMPAEVIAILAVVVLVVIVVVAVMVSFTFEQQREGEDHDEVSTIEESIIRDMEIKNRIIDALVDVISVGGGNNAYGNNNNNNAKNAAALLLQDSSDSSPYSKALQWILHYDDMELSANATNLLQRYVVALLYYSTTEDGPWTACNPLPTTTQNSEEQEEVLVEEEDNDNMPLLCYYLGLNGGGLWDGQGLAYTIHQQTTHQELLATRWLSGEHECQWAGLFCNDKKTVEWIQLDEMNMTGTIPNEISMLEDLELISLSKNSLHGPLPPAISRLSKLDFIDLRENFFSGGIPHEWYGGLTSLRHINLSFNPLLDTWTIPTMISQWSNLRILWLQSTQITGEIPTEIYSLSNLSYLYLGSNSITGTLATQLGLLSNVEILGLFGNLFSGSIPSEISKMTNLLEVSLAGSLLTGTIPEELYLADYKKLNALILKRNHLSGTISSSVGKLTTLGYLYITDNPGIAGHLPSEIGLLTKLQKLVISGTQLSGSVPLEICANRGSGYLARLKADCEPLSNGDIPLFCPEGCCTKCCNQESGVCTKTLYETFSRDPNL